MIQVAVCTHRPASFLANVLAVTKQSQLLCCYTQKSNKYDIGQLAFLNVDDVRKYSVNNNIL